MKPIFGNVVERNSNTSFIPKDVVKITLGESFPSSKKLLQRKDKKSIDNIDKSNLSNVSTSFDKDIKTKNAEKIMNEIENRNEKTTDYGQANLDIVLGMSPEEVEDAVAEFSTLFSEKTLEFLKNRALATINNAGNKKNDTKGIQSNNNDIKDNVDERHILGNYKKTVISKQSILHNNDSQNPIKEYLPISKPTINILNSKSKRIDIVNKINDCPIPVTSEDYIASTLEELSIKEKAFKLQENRNNYHSNKITPLYPPPNVTVDADNNIINKKIVDPIMASAVNKTVPSQILRISTDRFNLEGNRVLNRLETIESLKETLSLPDITFLRGISKSGIDCMAKACVDTMFNCGFAVEDLDIQDQPQNELLHHERDEGVLGYTLADISEMFRSEAPKKRAMALRIFSGILRNRDAVVSSECYNYTSLNDQFLWTSKNSISCVDKFYKEYECLVLLGKNILDDEKIWDHSIDAIFIKKLKRLLSFALLVLSAVDLPPDLPVLLLMALQMKDLQKTSFQNDVVICLKNYLCSDSEEKAAQYLWSPFDGDRSCPILPMPHVRRSEVSYEEHIGDCCVKLHKQYEETDENNEDGKFSKLPIYQAFALRCRFGRVDVMVAESTLVAILVSAVDEGVKLYTFLEKFSSQTNSLLQTSLHSIHILCTLCRQGNEHTIQTIQESVIKILWKKFTCLDSDIGLENIDILSQDSWNSLLTSWWCLIAELARRDSIFLEWMWKNGIGVKILGFILRFESRRSNPLFYEPFKDVVWAMRLWRIGLCSGYGLDQVSEFLLAVQIPRINQENDKTNDENINNYRTGLSIRNDLYTSELFQLLEQATISVSNELFHLKFEIKKSGSSSSSILVSGSPLNFKNSIDLLNLSRILITCSNNLLQLYLSFFNLKNDVKFLSSLGHFISAVIGVRHDDISTMNYTLLVERNTGLVESCLNFDLKFRSSMGDVDTKKDDSSVFRTADSATINTMLLQLLGLVESFLSNPILVEISSKIISKLIELGPSSIYLYGSSTNLLNVRNESTMRRLLMSILSRKWNDFNPEELLSITTIFIDELKKCESQTTSVSEGLIAWEISSLRSSKMLVSLYIIHMAYNKGVISVTDWIYSLMGCLRCLGQGMTESIVVILNQTVQDILKSAMGYISDDSLIPLQEAVLIAILGEDYKTQISNRSDTNIISSIYHVYYGGKIVNKNLGEDLSSVIYNSKFPLQRDWMFNILCELKGVNFCLWLKLLATLENNSLSGISGYNSGRKLYKVIKTTKAVHSFRWTLFEAEDSIGGVELEIPTPIPGSVEAFSELIQSIVISASFVNSEFYENFLLSCNEEVQAPIISQKSFNKSSSANKSSGNETGILTLCDLLLEATTCQQICHDVHSLVLNILISPLIQSWRVKDKIWRELGSLRLLHLIEGPQLVSTLPLFILEENNISSLSPALAQNIIDSLSNLRSDEDKEWNICLVGVYMIYSFIFEKEVNDSNVDILSGRRSKFFYDIINNSFVPDWLLFDILYFSECFIENKFPFLQFLSTLKIHLNINNQNSIENYSIISEKWSKLCSLIDTDWKEARKVSRSFLQSNSNINSLKILSKVIKIKNIDSSYSEIEIKDILKNSHRFNLV